jgi:hypothetical protein
MTVLRLVIHLAFAAFLIHGPVAAALEFQEAEALKLYGGTYSTDCSNPTAPKLQLQETLKVEFNNKRMTGTNLMAAYSYYGQNPPPNHQVTLISDVRGDAQLMFDVYRDKAGLYVLLQGDPKVETALAGVLGKSQTRSKFRDCDAASRTPPPRPATLPAPTTTDTLANWDFFHDRQFKRLYHKALGSKVRTYWLAALDGPAPPVKTVSVAGTEYRLLGVCKSHDCADNNTVILYSPARKIVYATVFERGKTTLIGHPPAAVATELDRLWKSEWRQQQ